MVINSRDSRRRILLTQLNYYSIETDAYTLLLHHLFQLMNAGWGDLAYCVLYLKVMTLTELTSIYRAKVLCWNKNVKMGNLCILGGAKLYFLKTI